VWRFADLRESRLLLTPDDALVLYTDGVTEVRRGRELFGYERLVETVSALRGRTVEELAEGVRDAAVGFAGRLRDDLHVVAFRLVGGMRPGWVVPRPCRCLAVDLDLYDPRRRPELLQAGGRGFYVMARLMDELEVHIDGGTVIHMNKRFVPRRAV
jgi:hypothetical protein